MTSGSVCVEEANWHRTTATAHRQQRQASPHLLLLLLLPPVWHGLLVTTCATCVGCTYLSADEVLDRRRKSLKLVMPRTPSSVSPDAASYSSSSRIWGQQEGGRGAAMVGGGWGSNGGRRMGQ